MQNKRILLPTLLSIFLIFSLILPVSVAGTSSTAGSVLDGYAITYLEADSSRLGSAMALNLSQGEAIPMVAAGGYHTVGLRADGTVLAAGLEVELAEWNVGSPALELTISSAIGGDVTQPGEGTFTYYPGRRLNLVAKPESGHLFVNWTGHVDAIANVNAAHTTITMNDRYSITANFEEGGAVNWALVGGLAGAVVVAGLVVFSVRRKIGV